MGAILLTCGPSLVHANTEGGFFHWGYDKRTVMPLIEVPGGSNLRSSHGCFPIFGLPAGLFPGATEMMKRHGLLRVSKLTVLSSTEPSVEMELANRPKSPNDGLLAQYPFYFAIRQSLRLLDPNTLRFRLAQQNLSAEAAKSTLALHSYFTYTEKGVTLPDLGGKVYTAFNNGQELGSARWWKPALSGKPEDRDWDFPVDRSFDSFRLVYPDGAIITLSTQWSDPPVTDWMVWMDPTQCALPNAFVCAEPVIRDLMIQPGKTAILDVVIQYQAPRLAA
jgi:galactose mutarotase-like enzyme